MDEENEFIEIDGKANRIEESKVVELWKQLGEQEDSLERKLRVFRMASNLPLRKLAEITNINKDKINKLIK